MIITSMLVFVIAFAVGCLSGVVIALWPPRRRSGKPERTASFLRLSEDGATAVQRLLRR